MAHSSAAVSYAWSTGDTTSEIRGQADSTYSVSVTDAGGCTASASYTVPAATSLLSSYVILADDDIRLYNNTVFEGGVGARRNNGGIWLKNMTQVTAAGTFIRSNDINISSGSTATVQINSTANVALPAFESNPYQSNQDVNVAANSTMVLSGGVYDDIMVGTNSTLTFTQTDIYVDKIYTRSGAALKFADCTRLHIRKKLHIGSTNSFNPDEYEVIVFVGDYVEVNPGSSVTADIYVRDGNLFARAASASNPTVMKGLFIAEDIEAKDNVHWFQRTTCNTGCQVPAQPIYVMKSSENLSLSSDPAVDQASAITDDARLRAYPNPFSDKLTIEFTVQKDSEVALHIFNLAGQRIAVPFEGNVFAGDINKVEYTPDNTTEGIIIYRLQTHYGAFYDKAVLVR